MQIIPIDEQYIHGAVSLEKDEFGCKPWRLPYDKITLYAKPLVQKAEMPAGVRVGLMSTTRQVHLTVVPNDVERAFSCVIDDELVETSVLAPGEEEVCFSNLKPENKRVEIYLPLNVPVILRHLTIEPKTTYAPLPDDRPRMIAYGSSITHAVGSASPAQTWPALVARRWRLHLTSLGYGAQCHIEPMTALMIRDLPADFITLCLGINVIGQNSLSLRTCQAAVIGMIRIIREKHSDIPLVVQSPIYATDREIVENKVGFTTVKMRAEILSAVSKLQEMGDANLYYVDGLRIFGAEHKEFLADKLHPNADGYCLMADNYERVVMEGLGIGRQLRSRKATNT
ncbi:MAG TPA: GDSL family lipase [Firmicutes bacterium]|nr:GDSL family lipase [Bacillota bacterium]